MGKAEQAEAVVLQVLMSHRWNEGRVDVLRHVGATRRQFQHRNHQKSRRVSNNTAWMTGGGAPQDPRGVPQGARFVLVVQHPTAACPAPAYSSAHSPSERNVTVISDPRRPRFSHKLSSVARASHEPHRHLPTSSP